MGKKYVNEWTADSEEIKHKFIKATLIIYCKHAKRDNTY